MIITQTAIGAPAGTTDWQMLGKDYIRAVELLLEKHPHPEKIKGILTPQNGKSSSTNGWLSASALGLAVVDATGDIRAHPTGKMGNMGVANDTTYGKLFKLCQVDVVKQVAILSYPCKERQLTLRKFFRIASDLSGGFIAAARHPLTVSYIKQNAVIGGLSKAIELGYCILEHQSEDGSSIIDAIVKHTHGEILAKGKVIAKDMTYTDEAFDVGKVKIKTESDNVTLHVQNEFMAVDSQALGRVATYPDVITLFRAKDAKALSTDEISIDEEVVVFKISHKHFPLSYWV